MVENKSVTLHLDQEEIAKLCLLHEEERRDPPNEYMSDFFQSKEVTIAVFKKEKNGLHAVTFQGDKAAYEASIFGYEEPIPVKIKAHDIVRKSKAELPQIGSDEVGTGDYFGPVIVTAAYVDQSALVLLEKLGVTDSKLLNDEKILQIGPELIHHIDYASIAVSPKEYNRGRYEVGLNMNAMKAALHNRVLLNLSKRHPGVKLYQDQFAAPATYFSYLKYEEEVARNITFSTKGELAFVSVAAASCIARYHFLRKMDELAKKLGVDKIPFGAGKEVDAFAKRVLKGMNETELSEYVKLNFENTKRLLEE